jgi:hypothetical protein
MGRIRGCRSDSQVIDEAETRLIGKSIDVADQNSAADEVRIGARNGKLIILRQRSLWPREKRDVSMDAIETALWHEVRLR